MKLLMNTSPFRLEQGYELVFGPSVFDTMAEVILAFREPWQDIVAGYSFLIYELGQDTKGILSSILRIR